MAPSSSQKDDVSTGAGTPRRTALSSFLPTSRRLVQFSNGRTPEEGARIVYIDGAFDVFHPGHVKILKAAKAEGDFLLVGLHTDEDVTSRRGPHLPIMSLHERSLSVLACKYVDEVVIGSPMVITRDLITTFNISVVVRGDTSETAGCMTHDTRRYEVPKQMGINRVLQVR
jgi:ethanolamine-phosphate cytidylyltransferase